MKKIYTLVVLAGLSAAAFAQTTPQTAYDVLPTAENTYTWEDGNSDYIYWKYVNTSDHSVLLKVFIADQNGYVSFADANGNTNSEIRLDNGKTLAYPVAAGDTVYLRATKGYSSATISFTIEEVEVAYDPNSTTENPMLIADGGSVVVGKNGYISYTATEDGVLELLSTNYISTGNYTAGTTSGQLSFTSGSTGYLAKLPVVAGNTYVIYVEAYSAFVLDATLTHPVKGASYDYAYDVLANETTVPAAFGKYWYSFTAPVSGYFTLSSEETLTGGNVAFFNDPSSASYYTNGSTSSASATSTTGSFNLRYEVEKGRTYYFVVNKVESTTAEQSFTATIAEYQIGERAENPIILTSGEAQTLPSAQGTYYYAITVPEGDNQTLNVVASGSLLSGTSVSVYAEGNAYSATSGSSSVSLTVTGGQRYIVCWTSNEEEPLSFTATLKEIEAGDIFEKPIAAESGMNSFTGEGTKYYSYTATLTGKLSVLPSDLQNITISFPQGSSSWSGSYTATVINGASVIDVVAGTTYVIKFSGAGVSAESFFVLSEREYVAGESETMPIALDGDTYTFPNEPVDVWVSYTVAQDGVMLVTSDMAVDQSNNTQVYYKKQGSYIQSAVGSENNQPVIKATVQVSAGDVYLFHISSAAVQEGKTLNIAVRDYAEGETIAKAIELQAGETYDLGTASYANPIWVKVRVQNGTLVLTNMENYSASGSLYTDSISAAQDHGSYIYMTDYDYSTYQSLDNYIYTTSISLAEGVESAVYYIKFQSGTLQLTVSGDALVEESNDPTALTQVKGEAAVVAPVQVYNLAGQAVPVDSYRATRGIYIVVEGGKTHKEIVK
jgi:hypothetical protein